MAILLITQNVNSYNIYLLIQTLPRGHIKNLTSGPLTPKYSISNEELSRPDLILAVFT